MDGFTAHRLRFECQALEPMELYEWQGSGLRGALFRALWGNFCMNRVRQGKKPACVHHCMTKCMAFGPMEEMSELAAKKRKTVVWGRTF